MPAPPLARILFPSDAIHRRVDELAEEIRADYGRAGSDGARPPVVVGILRGCLYFLADLTRRMDMPLEIDTMAISSYGSGTESSGAVRILKDLDGDIAGRDVLVVEDIVDTGLTLDALLRALGARAPSSVRVCTLLSKPARRRIPVPVDYVGFEVPDLFVVGYGLDYDQGYRNLPCIGVPDFAVPR